MTPFAKAALGYARNLDWPVFPIAPGRKAPPLVASWPQRATADPKIVDGWWAIWPDANVGLHCAALLTLDVDARKNGRATLDSLISQFCRLPPTVASLTPNGWHVFLRCPARVGNSASQLGPGLDVRSRGGYVVLPPSIRADGVYHWAHRRAPDEIDLADAPEWLVRLLTPQPRSPPRPSPRLVMPERLVRYALNQDLEAVRAAPSGRQNATLYVTARKLGRFAAAGLLDWGELRDVLAAASVHHDDSERQRLATIHSGLNSRMAP
jgi:putative DNA primase/helicase